MIKQSKLIIIFIIILVLVIAGGVCWYQISFKNQKSTNLVETPEVRTPETKDVSTRFVDSLLSELPDTYIVSEAEYIESSDLELQKAIEVKPCDDSGADPSRSPLCFTRLVLLDKQEKTNDLDEFIGNNKIMSWYEGAQETKLVKAVFQNTIPFVYTPKSFACFGTGAESCLRKRFAYHLPDGSNVLAEVQFWPYNNGERIGESIKEVQEVVAIYEELLMQ